VNLDHVQTVEQASDGSRAATNRAGGKLDALRTEISTAANLPLVFPSSALTWPEFDPLRVLIRQNCTVVDSTDYRSNPGAHKVCPR
jgi:hypothetical protein